MNPIIKQLLIIGSSFLLVLWYQHVDDKRNKRERNTFYNKYKFPVLVAAIVGLVLSFTNYLNYPVHIDNNPDAILIVSEKIKNTDLSEQEIFTELPDYQIFK